MHLRTPAVGDPVGGHLQRAHHRARWSRSPCAACSYRPMGAEGLLRRNLLIYGLGGIIAPFIGIKLIDMLLSAVHFP